MRLTNTLPLAGLVAALTLTSLTTAGCRKRTVRVEPNEIPRTETTTPTPPPAGTTPTPGDAPPPTSPTTPPTTDPQPTSPNLRGGGTRVRVIHAAPATPAVDIVVNDSAAITGLAYKAATTYVRVPASTVRAAVVRAGSDTAVLAPTDLTFAEGHDYTVVALGKTQGDAVTPLILTDENAAPLAGKARLRVLHAAPDAPAVDVLVNDRPAISNLTFGKATPLYTQLDAGTYQIKLVPTSGGAPALGPLPLALRAGKVYTVIATGSAANKTLTVQAYTDN